MESLKERAFISGNAKVGIQQADPLVATAVVVGLCSVGVGRSNEMATGRCDRLTLRDFARRRTRGTRIRPLLSLSPHHAELVAPGVGHAHAVRAAVVGATGPECQQTLDFGVEG